jgi:hypothetical protein
MLDLDQLATRRAKTLNQKEDHWKKAVWSQDFQYISASMSDGEVEALLELCSSVPDFERVVKFLKARSERIGISPYSVLEQEAATAGISVDAWIKSHLGSVK